MLDKDKDNRHAHISSMECGKTHSDREWVSCSPERTAWPQDVYSGYVDWVINVQNCWMTSLT